MVDEAKDKDLLEQEALKAAQEAELNAVKESNAAQYQNQGQIINDIQSKINAAKKVDETALRRENAFRYISGLGDTLSSVANLVGVANGASNQQQAYNSHAVVQKAEEARKARKLEMDDLSKRLDEMTARQRDLKAAGSLAEAKIAVQNQKDMLKLQSEQRKANEALARQNAELEYKKERDVRADKVADRAFDESVRQFNENQERLKEQTTLQGQLQEKKIQADLDAKEQKKSEDPKHRERKLNENLVGIRDELAKKMGYADYNEYLKYQKVEGWGKDLGGQRNKDTKAIRKKRSSEFPEIEEFLNQLASPGDLTPEQINALMSASSVFAEAVGSATEPAKASNGKKKVW